MTDTNSDVKNVTDRSIDDDRIHRAMTESITVRDRVRGQYLVQREGRAEHLVDVHTGHCDCEDAHFRDVVCVHLARACIHHLFRSANNTQLVARVAAAVSEHGCPGDVSGCGGPTTTGDRGIPCEECIAATSSGHWTVWCYLTGATDRADDGPAADADAEPVAVTDGGEDRDESPARSETVCLDCGAPRVGGECDCGSGVDEL